MVMINGTYSFRGISLPENLKESIDAYIQTGRPLGGFLKAIIENDLKDACGRADESNVGILHVIIGYLYNEAPMNCWGFKGAHDEWVRLSRIARITGEI